MNPDSAAELAGRLNAKISAFVKIPSGFQTYSQADIAAAVGLMKLERDRLWIHVAYCRHIGFYQDLKRELLEEIVNKFYREKWHIDRPHLLSDMIDTAVLETLQSHICPRCNGQKTVIWTPEEAQTSAKKLKQPELIKMESKSGNCPKCQGTGIVGKSDYWRARNCDMERSKWWYSWKDRYQKVLEIIRSSDDCAKAALAKRLTLVY